MWGNFGLESEAREENRRARGRRHAPRDETPSAAQPTYMSAPFATTEEAPRLSRRPAPQPVAERGGHFTNGAPDEMERYGGGPVVFNGAEGSPHSAYAPYNTDGPDSHFAPHQEAEDEEDILRRYAEQEYAEQQQQQQQQEYGEQPSVDPRRYILPESARYSEADYSDMPPSDARLPPSAPASQVYSPPPAGLRKDRLERGGGGLNIFTWNNDTPVAPPPRVQRNRDDGELQRLRPHDAQAMRDREVREKFEGNTNSRFLCFSDSDKSRQARQRSAPTMVPTAPAVPVVSAAAEPRFGRRRSNPTGKENDQANVDGIAGFAGMGSRGHAKGHHMDRKPQVSQRY